MSEELSNEEKLELEKEIKKSTFIFNILYSAGLDFESSEKLAWGDINKCDYLEPKDLK